MDRYEDLSDCEVDDHSFFDSDFGEQSKTTDYTPVASKQTEGKGENSLHTNNSNSTVGNSVEENQPIQEESDKGEQLKKPSGVEIDQTTISSVMSVNHRSECVYKEEVAAQNIKINTVIPTGIPKIRDSADKYDTDEDDSSDERKKRLRPKSAKQSNNLKKSIGKKYSRFSASSSSSDADCLDTESESYLLEPSNSSLSRKSSRSVKSLEENSKLRDYTEESEDTVTDVTPLSTPDISPIQSFDLATTSEMLKKNKIKRQENVNQEIYDSHFDEKYNEKALHDAMDLNQLLKAFMRLDKKEQRSLATETPATKVKNYSFTRDEVRQIDRENQRLLKELSRQNSGIRSSNIFPKKLTCPPVRLYHSAVNRQREQQRIEKDNLLCKSVPSKRSTRSSSKGKTSKDVAGTAKKVTQKQVAASRAPDKMPQPSKCHMFKTAEEEPYNLEDLILELWQQVKQYGICWVRQHLQIEALRDVKKTCCLLSKQSHIKCQPKAQPPVQATSGRKEASVSSSSDSGFIEETGSCETNSWYNTHGAADGLSSSVELSVHNSVVAKTWEVCYK